MSDSYSLDIDRRKWKKLYYLQEMTDSLNSIFILTAEGSLVRMLFKSVSFRLKGVRGLRDHKRVSAFLGNILHNYN